ncbi:anhydro-N-acetylmuramic acid kinase [Vibrio sp. FNV 38]|nr:anhydro-N-acetylmuramic acid kinase [Vibrio sp. FNV 38]
MTMRELYIGLMSGTSLDGVDSVVVAIDNHNIELIASYEHPIPSSLRKEVLAVCTGQSTTLPAIGRIDHQLGKLYAATVQCLLNKAGLSAQAITAIGNHGQTVFHHPQSDEPFTMQLGDANLISAETGIDTVADFRRLDMAVGGQGAPLVPAFHQYLFSLRDSSTVILNIGGISNISVIPPDNNVVGYDTGPGNMLMDAWCEKHTGHQYDHSGTWAASGKMLPTLLQRLMADPYLQKTPPKSTGREHYNLYWLEKQLSDDERPQDVQRTLCEFTARSIAEHITTHKYGSDCELLLCGGGANNTLLTDRLTALLPEWNVMLSSEKGVPQDYMEAMAFAWLARQRIHNQPSNLPAVTGAQCKVSLGVIYPAIKEFS